MEVTNNDWLLFLMYSNDLSSMSYEVYNKLGMAMTHPASTNKFKKELGQAEYCISHEYFIHVKYDSSFL